MEIEGFAPQAPIRFPAETFILILQLQSEQKNWTNYSTKSKFTDLQYQSRLRMVVACFAITVVIIFVFRIRVSLTLNYAGWVQLNINRPTAESENGYWSRVWLQTATLRHKQHVSFTEKTFDIYMMGPLIFLVFYPSHKSIHIS